MSSQREIFKGERESEKELEKEFKKNKEINYCCFCGERCNIYSQSCGGCSRKYSISGYPVKFFWEDKEEDKKDETKEKKR